MIGKDIGWDFSIFWEIGRAILEGRNPYAVEFSRYPPATAFFFALFGLLPFVVSFVVWSTLNVGLYLHGLRRARLGWKGLTWLLYTPFLFNLLTGQIDVIFWWAAFYLVKDSSSAPDTPHKTWDAWRPALAAAFLTLKPQLAAVLLPWYLVRWLRGERGLLWRWLGITALIHALPLLYDPGIYGRWLAALSGVSEMKMGVSAGVFAFGLLGLPTLLLAAVGLALAVWGLFQPEPTSRAAQLCAFPITIWYDDVLLTGIGPAWLMMPLSWVAFITAGMVQNSLPLVAISVAALGFRLFKKRQTEPLPRPLS
jgi:hypothetical protein